MRAVKKINELMISSLLAAMLLVFQIALSGLPNIELVTLFFILYTLVYPGQVLKILCVFLLLEGFLYGFGLWWFSWLYVWPLLCFTVHLMRRFTSPFLWAVTSCLFGLIFGLLCSASYLIIGGPGAAFAWWIAGIPFDILHGISNFIITLVLFKPLHSLLARLKISNS